MKLVEYIQELKNLHNEYGDINIIITNNNKIRNLEKEDILILAMVNNEKTNFGSYYESSFCNIQDCIEKDIEYKKVLVL